MYHDSKGSIQERLPSSQQPIISETYRNVIIVEALPILHKLWNVSADNFYEFVFYKYVIRLVEGFDRLDVVFDRYFKNSFSGVISSANQKRTRFVRYTGVTDN